MGCECQALCRRAKSPTASGDTGPETSPVTGFASDGTLSYMDRPTGGNEPEERRDDPGHAEDGPANDVQAEPETVEDPREGHPDDTEPTGEDAGGEQGSDHEPPSRSRFADFLASTETCKNEAVILVLFQRGRGLYGDLDRSVYYEVARQVDQLLPGGQRGAHLDIWLHSPGGDIHAAYKLAYFLRERFSTVHVVVPDYAKSAATLLSLAGERIYMGPGAELGPLDVQDRREGDDRMHSTLDTANAMSTIFRDSLTLALESGPLLLHTTGLARDRTIDHLLDFTAAFTRPLVEKIDPEEMLSASTSLLLSIEYASRLFSDVHDVTKDAAQPLASALVTQYPTHGHVIDRTEAREVLRLPVHELESYSWSDECASLLRLHEGRPAAIWLCTIDDVLRLLKSADDEEGEFHGYTGHSHTVPEADDDHDDDVEGDDPESDAESTAGSQGDHGPAGPSTTEPEPDERHDNGSLDLNH